MVTYFPNGATGGRAATSGIIGCGRGLHRETRNCRLVAAAAGQGGGFESEGVALLLRFKRRDGSACGGAIAGTAASWVRENEGGAVQRGRGCMPRDMEADERSGVGGGVPVIFRGLCDGTSSSAAVYRLFTFLG